MIWLDEDSAIEYDCNPNGLGVDYCLHFMSKTPTMSQEKLDQLITFSGELSSRSNLFKGSTLARRKSFLVHVKLKCKFHDFTSCSKDVSSFISVGMDLNPNDIEYKPGSHEGCWEDFE